MPCPWKALLAILIFLPVTTEAFAESPIPAPTRTSVTSDGFVADLYMPADARSSLPAVIVLGGSRGGLDERIASEAKALARRGYAALQLAYIAAPGLPTALHLIPLEYFKTARDWLSAQPLVDAGRIGIVGTSIGGMIAPGGGPLSGFQGRGCRRPLQRRVAHVRPLSCVDVLLRRRTFAFSPLRAERRVAHSRSLR
jgi:hypothetical protein